MKRALVLVAAALTACGGAKIDATAARNALPTSAAVQIATPDQTTSQALTAGGSAAVATAPQSGAYQLTHGLAAAVNGGVGVWIGLLELVVALPPTSCAADTCTWGPWTDQNPLNPVNATYELTVTKQGDAQYAYAFKAAPGTATAFVDIVAGSVTTDGVPHHGAGSFTIDLDAARTINPASADTGKLAVTHDNTAGLKIGVTFTGCTEQHDQSHLGEKLNAAYAFDQGSTSGDLQVAVHYLTTGAQFTLESRWDMTGAGRCDLTYQSPTPGQGSECWGARPAFSLLYNSLDPAYQDPSGCVFQTAQYASLTVP